MPFLIAARKLRATWAPHAPNAAAGEVGCHQGQRLVCPPLPASRAAATTNWPQQRLRKHTQLFSINSGGAGLRRRLTAVSHSATGQHLTAHMAAQRASSRPSQPRLPCHAAPRRPPPPGPALPAPNLQRRVPSRPAQTAGNWEASGSVNELCLWPGSAPMDVQNERSPHPQHAQPTTTGPVARRPAPLEAVQAPKRARQARRVTCPAARAGRGGSSVQLHNQAPARRAPPSRGPIRPTRRVERAGSH